MKDQLSEQERQRAKRRKDFHEKLKEPLQMLQQGKGKDDVLQKIIEKFHLRKLGAGNIDKWAEQLYDYLLAWHEAGRKPIKRLRRDWGAAFVINTPVPLDVTKLVILSNKLNRRLKQFTGKKVTRERQEQYSFIKTLYDEKKKKGDIVRAIVKRYKIEPADAKRLYNSWMKQKRLCAK